MNNCTVYELTKGSEIGCMTYLKKVFDYDRSIWYKSSKKFKIRKNV